MENIIVGYTKEVQASQDKIKNLRGELGILIYKVEMKNVELRQLDTTEIEALEIKNAVAILKNSISDIKKQMARETRRIKELHMQFAE